MHCSTSLTELPILPRLPRGLVSLLILSLLLQTCPLFMFPPLSTLPSFTIEQRPSLSWRVSRRRGPRHARTAWHWMTGAFQFRGR